MEAAGFAGMAWVGGGEQECAALYSADAQGGGGGGGTGAVPCTQAAAFACSLACPIQLQGNAVDGWCRDWDHRGFSYGTPTSAIYLTANDLTMAGCFAAC